MPTQPFSPLRLQSPKSVTMKRSVTMKLDRARGLASSPRLVTRLLLVSIMAVWGSMVAAEERPTSVATPATAALRRSYGLNLQLSDPPAGYATRAELLGRIGLGLVKLIDVENDPLPPAVQEIRDITYGEIGERKLQLDLYQPLLDLSNIQAGSAPAGPNSVAGKPSSTELRPGLIFIHGGAWSGGQREIYHYYTKRMALMGFVATTISYRLSGEAVFPAAVQDAKCAVRWLRAHAAEYSVDPERIAVLGGSAGGHLAMMVGYAADPALEGPGGHQDTSSRVAAVVNLYGPSDLTTPSAKSAEPVERFLGGKFAELQPSYEQASPVLHLDPQDPPTLIIHGDLDELVNISQSDELAQKLEAARVPFAYDRITGWPHTLDLAAVMNEHCLQTMARFLSEVLQHPLPGPAADAEQAPK